MTAQRLNDKLVNFASILDPKTAQQAYNTSKMGFIFPHLALMPDAHLGKGATVGSVIPTHNAIMPAAVGVDIGCGMIAVRTQFTQADVNDRISGDGGYNFGPHPLSHLRDMIENAIPLGKGKQNASLRYPFTARRLDALDELAGIGQADTVKPDWRHQLGTLGGGNHFIECSYDENDNVWLFLHSGSRGVGNKLANVYIKAAREQCKKNDIRLPDPDLAFLTEGTDLFSDYIQALKWAQVFARLNREEMMDRLAQCFSIWMETLVVRREAINCHHNYTEYKYVLGQGVWLSRKGAIDATIGRPGLIPGSMGDLSYVVSGKGNPLALHSAPHGAGRQLSRSAAKRELTYTSLQERMKGIEWRNSEAFLDEHPESYKPIHVVMEDAEDLVSVDHTLRQFLNVKGE